MVRQNAVIRPLAEKAEHIVSIVTRWASAFQAILFGDPSSFAADLCMNRIGILAAMPGKKIQNNSIKSLRLVLKHEV